MHNLLHPRILIFINTLPSILLALIFYNAYDTIVSQLDPYAIMLWKRFSLAFAVLTLGTLAYSIRKTKRDESLSAAYGLVSLLFYVPSLYIYAFYFEYLVPWEIPDWMVPQNLFLYVGSFIMPSMAHALLVILIGITPRPSEFRQNWKNFVLALSIPLIWYIFIEVIQPLWRFSHFEYEEHVMIISLLVGTTIFLLFLARGIYILAARRGGNWRERELLWKIPVALVFPFLGLALNQGILKISGFLPENMFGNFSHYWFYVLTAVNGMALCFPNPDAPFHRLLLFILRSVTLSFSLYFFLIFIPFLPLSIIAILAFGLGFLLLTPFLLIVIHGMDLQRDFQALRAHYQPRVLQAILVLGTALIPMIITGSYSLDRNNLHQALDYIYESNYDEPIGREINRKALRRVLETVGTHKRDFRDQLSIGETPFLSHWYSWIVLDNLTLSSNKVRLMKSIFFGERHSSVHYGKTVPSSQEEVKLTGIVHQSEYDPVQEVWRSEIELSITNGSTRQREYATSFELPVGAWISDYYLWIEGEKVPGILAEKKAANWVYRNITSRRRDPGILYYLNNREVALRVFPLAAGQERRTGFEILHKEPLHLTIDDDEVLLGNVLEQEPLSTAIYSEDREVVYLPSALKTKLPRIQRQPYWHFILDCSIGNDSLITQYQAQIEYLLDQNPAWAAGAQISLLNTYVKTDALAKDWRSQIQRADFAGGFYLERGLKSILLSGLEAAPATYPQLVVLSPDFSQAILPNDLSEWAMAYPELKHFQVWEGTGERTYHSLVKRSWKKLPATEVTPPGEVLAWPNAQQAQRYLSTEPGPEILLLKPSTMEALPEATPRKEWKSALQLEGQWQSYQYYPKNNNLEWLALVRNSFQTRFLCPLTSYISLENEAQRIALEKKQAQVLKADQSLDAGEDLNNMSEPSWWLCLILFGLWACWYRRKHPYWGMT